MKTTNAKATPSPKQQVIIQITSQKTYLPESKMRQQVEADLNKLSMSTVYGLQTLIALRLAEQKSELECEHAALNTVAEAAKRHLVVEKGKVKWLQNWLHNGEGKTLSEVSRASLGQLLAEMFQLTSGSKLPQTLAALAAIRGGEK
jgi:hypothetical protein